MLAFEENERSVWAVLIEMTTPIKSKIHALEVRLDVLQTDLDGLNERYVKHTELHNTWKIEFELVDVEMLALEEKLNGEVESLACFPAMSKENVIRHVKILIENE